MADSESTSPHPTELRHEAFLLRAQGFSFRKISRLLGERGTPVPPRTIANWALSRDGAPLIEQLSAQLRAGMQEQANAVVPKLFRRIRLATKAGDARSVDQYARAVVALTKGIVPDRLELVPSVPDSADELAALLARHGVQLEQRAPEARGSQTSTLDL